MATSPPSPPPSPPSLAPPHHHDRPSRNSCSYPCIPRWPTITARPLRDHHERRIEVGRESLNQLQSSSHNDPNNCRSLWDIIRSCTFTIFLCIWVSVHPNVPSPDDGWPKVTIRRVGLVVATLIAPEAMIVWAWRQRQFAIELAEIHKHES
jgi:hypothetical protein